MERALKKPLRLSDHHAAALEELLVQDPLVNLFLLGYLDAVPISRTHWYGVAEAGRLRAAVVVVTGRLAVPWAPDPDDAELLGELLLQRHRPTMMVGPREACDVLWARWGRDAAVDRWYDQHLYVCEAPVAGDPAPSFRRAHPDEWAQVAEAAAAMELEDLGRAVAEADRDAFHETIRRRIERGSTWVMAEGDELVFQINVGTTGPWGAQVGGTWVPPHHRGRGLATLGMQELGRRLMPRLPRLTLHVNEANTPAVRVYERSGYRPYAPYRLVTLTTP